MSADTNSLWSQVGLEWPALPTAEIKDALGRFAGTLSFILRRFAQYGEGQLGHGRQAVPDSTQLATAITKQTAYGRIMNPAGHG
jgi:hypothetical protein